MRGDIPWDDDPEVGENVVVCAFMSHSSLNLSTFNRCTKGYRLHFSDGAFQLYNKHKGDTFVFISRPAAASGEEVATSIALQKISQRVQKVRCLVETFCGPFHLLRLTSANWACLADASHCN